MKNIRAEQEILKDFEKLGWKKRGGFANKLTLYKQTEERIFYDSKITWNCFMQFNENKTYSVIKLNNFATNEYNLSMQEHKLINELLTIWGWL